MAYIAFANSASDCERLSRYYADSSLIRVPMDSLSAMAGNLPDGIPLWVDPAVDGLTGRSPWPAYRRYMESIKGHELLGDSAFIRKPNQTKVDEFVQCVLEGCLSFSPAWITVPQLPVVAGSERNKINRNLAKATERWRSQRGFQGKLVLPLIFTHAGQLRGRTQWRNKIELSQRCFELAGANVVWAVDASLADLQGARKLQERFRSLVCFHEDLLGAFEKATIVAGPYWGMNLVLWARGLCEYPAVSLGTGYRYYVSGGFRRRPKTRIAVTPLRRWATVSPGLQQWLTESLGRLSRQDPAYSALAALEASFPRFASREAATDQVAEFYRSWVGQIEETPPSGRTLAMYEDLSSAYVLGRKLPTLPATESPGRAPAIVAQQLMLNCL